MLIQYNSSPEEAEDLGLNVLYTFVQKQWNDKSEQLKRLARNFGLVYQCYRERGGDDRYEQQIQWLKKAVEAAKKSENNKIRNRKERNTDTNAGK